MLNILLIYYLLCGVYLVFFSGKLPSNWGTQLLILAFSPFIGPVILYYMFKKEKGRSDGLPEWLIKKKLIEERKALVRPDEERERNVVPFDDVLLLNDNKMKRKMLLDLLKNESLQSIDFLKTAIQDEDTETSHYAATAISDVKRKLLSAMQKLEAQIDQDPYDFSLVSSYCEVLKQYIEIEFLDERTKERSMYNYSLALEKLIEIKPREKEYYIEKINCDLQLKEFEKANDYSKLFLNYCSDCEEAYFLSMKVYFLLKNKQEFEETLQLLRNSPVRLSSQGLKQIRFWLQGDSNAS